MISSRGAGAGMDRQAVGGAAGRRRRALRWPQPPDYLLLTDADIAHTPDSVRALVARAESGGYVLTSLMAKLRCESFAERSHVPAFVFFFQMLYPFAWVNDPRNATSRPRPAAACW